MCPLKLLKSWVLFGAVGSTFMKSTSVCLNLMIYAKNSCSLLRWYTCLEQQTKRLLFKPSIVQACDLDYKLLVSYSGHVLLIRS